jgi:hypothetical protein
LREIDLTRQGFTGDISGLAVLADLNTLLLEYTRVAGDIATLTVLLNLNSLNLARTFVTGDIATLAVLLNLTSLHLHETSVVGQPESLSGLSNLHELQLGMTNVAGPVAALRALPGLGSGWGRDAVFGDAVYRGSCCCQAISTDGGLTHTPHDDCPPEFTRLLYFDMTPCAAYAAGCAEVGLALKHNATEIAGQDQCACCVGSEIVRSASSGICNHCAAMGEHLVEDPISKEMLCFRCPIPERCVDGACVGEGILEREPGCANCREGYFAVGLSCHKCPSAGSEYTQFVLAVGAVFGICVVLWKVSEADMDGLTAVDESEDLKSVSTAATSSLARVSNSAIVCSIVLPSLLQITITFTLPSFPVPDVLRTLGEWMSSVVAFDLGVLGTPECAEVVNGAGGPLTLKLKFFLTVRALQSCLLVG